VSKGKLFKFAEMETFANVFQPLFNEVFKKDFHLKGNWNKHFANSSPITIELGCGKGEYSVGLASQFTDRNFIGIDIKGARIWKGAKAALNEKVRNVCFLRTRIDFINSFFSADEVQEIWITFPDPQPKKEKKRLTSSLFLNRYRQFIRSDGYINLKTDSAELYNYTLNLALHNKLNIDFSTTDLYNSGYDNAILSIKTFYELMWLKAGLKIHYLRFQLNTAEAITEPPDVQGC
jgi:tRNA (guanine-N7-)-methyltransferase